MGIKPVCRFCGHNLPKGSPFGAVHKACYADKVKSIQENDGEEAPGHLDGLIAMELECV